MAMYSENHQTPLVCENGDRYEDEVLWRIQTVEDVDAPTNQVPEIRTLCRECNAPSRSRTAGLPTHQHAKGLRASGRGRAKGRSPVPWEVWELRPKCPVETEGGNLTPW
jgi:hypothetical protein